MSRPGPEDFVNKKLNETRLPEWVSRNLKPVDDPMGMLAVGTIVLAAGWLSFRLWRRLRRQPRPHGRR
jgi:hypothetical protein